MNSPYKGLMPYSEDDAPFFFGRAAEQEIIIANMNVSRLTLLYGASGVGKSSVLRAGIAHQLRLDAQKNLRERGTPEFGVVVFSSWRDDPVAALIARVQDEVQRTLSPNHLVTSSPAHPFTPSSLTDSLYSHAHRVGGDLYIILDQFEEYFLYHPDENGEGTFAFEFPRVLNREDLRVNFLLAIREDALAKLDRFKGRIPNLFDNYLRMEHLDTNAARDAIVKPLDEYNRLYANGSRVEIEPVLVDAVLEQTRTGQVIVGETGRGSVEREGGDEIETPYLQLVMTRLWNESTSPQPSPIQGEGAKAPLLNKAGQGEVVLRLETLERLGGAEKIVRTHLDTTMNALTSQEQEVSASIFNFLVTPSGTKIAHTAHDLADYAHAPQNEIATTLEKLSSGDIRILRPVAPPLDQPNEPRYEIFHDVLGAPILDWRTRFTQQQEKIESEKKLAAEKRRVRRLRFGLIGLSLLLLAVIALAVFAFTQRQEAERASAEAQLQKQEAENQKSVALAQKELAEQERKNAEAAKADAVMQQKIARSGELAALALGQLDSDPERALLIAREAMNTAQTTQAEDALRTALLDPYRLTFKGKGDAITDARITPDGKYAITLEPCTTVSRFNCGSLRIWDTQTGALISDLQMPKGAQVMDLSLDGKFIVTANDDYIARVWEIPSGKLVSELRGHEKQINDVHFSPDGKQVVTASADATAKLWEKETGNLVYEFKHKNVVRVAKFSPDGKYIATDISAGGTTSPGGAIFWDVKTGNHLSEISDTFISDFEFSPDSQFLAGWYDSALGTAAVSLWRVETGTKIAEFKDSQGVRSLAFSPNGNSILIGNADGTLRIYDALTGFSKAILVGHSRGVNSVEFSPDGKFVASAGGDNRTRWWLYTERDTGSMGDGTGGGNVAQSPLLEILQDLIGHTDRVNSVAFNSNGQSIITASDDGTARLWHVNAGEALVGHTNFVRAIAFSPDGKQLVTASKDGTARVWDASTRKTLFELRGHSGAIKSIAYSRDGSRLVTASEDKTARLWNANDGTLVFTMSDATGDIGTAEFSPDGKFIATGYTASRSEVTKMIVWDLETKSISTTIDLKDCVGFAARARWSKDSQKIAASCGNVVLVNLSTNETETLFANTNGVFSPDEKHVAGSNADGHVIIWDLDTEPIRGTHLKGHTNVIRTVEYSRDGGYILTASDDNTARVWDANRGKLLHELKGHTAEINRASFSPDGRFILTASNDKTARVWETPTGKLIEILRGHSDIVTDAAFSPDGKTIVTTGDTTARLYECIACAPLDKLLKLADARITRELTCEERVTFLRETIVCENP